MSDRAIVWNYGGGTQSVAIGVLIAQGRLPVPDVAVIADTGREADAEEALLFDASVCDSGYCFV